jgi:hypothetical protein
MIAMDTNQKSWTINTPPQKKYLSRLITYNLSRRLNRKLFEVVFEGYLDLFNPASEQPDVVVYSLSAMLIPVVAIEVCSKDELFEARLMAKRLVGQYRVDEFFIYEYINRHWFRITKDAELQISFSDILSLELRETPYPLSFL